MREHKIKTSEPDYEVWCTCSCGAAFWSNAEGLNCVMRNGAWVTVCPMAQVEKNLRKAAFPSFFSEGPSEVQLDIEMKRRISVFLGIAKR